MRWGDLALRRVLSPQMMAHHTGEATVHSSAPAKVANLPA